MWSPINWRIAGQPLNWFIVLSVLLVVAFAADTIMQYIQNANPSGSNEPGSLAAS